MLAAGLTEAITLCCLAVAGVVLHLTLLASPVDFLGESLTAWLRYTSGAAWIFMGAYGTARLAMLARARLLELRVQTEQAEDEASVRSVERGHSVRSRRKAVGIPGAVLAREEFFDRLAEEFRTCRRTKQPLSILLAKVEEVEADRATLLADVSGAILGYARATDVVGHLGDGLFAVAFPRMPAGKGQRSRQELCTLLLELAEEAGATVRESFASTNGQENLQGFYGRVAGGLRSVEFSATGTLRRVG